MSKPMTFEICSVEVTTRTVSIPGTCPGCNRDLTGIGALKESVLADRDWVGRFQPLETSTDGQGYIEHDYSVGGTESLSLSNWRAQHAATPSARVQSRTKNEVQPS